METVKNLFCIIDTIPYELIIFIFSFLRSTISLYNVLLVNILSHYFKKYFDKK